MQHNNRNVPDWLLERLALGELDAETAADVRRRLAAEGRSPDDIMQAVAASNREHPGRASRQPGRGRDSPARRQRCGRDASRTTAGFPLGRAARPRGRRGGGVDDLPGRPTETERSKGSEPSAAPRLYVYRHGADGNQRLSDGARAARGDLVQLAYGSRRGGYGVLLSIDGAGKVTLHWPEKQDGEAAPLKPSSENRLPSSYELDDAPAFERFFLVRAATPFAVATALEAARALAAQPSARTQALALPSNFEQISLALDKPTAAKKELP